MKLAISGIEYDYQTALKRAKLSVQRDLFAASGIGLQTVRRTLDRIDAARSESPRAYDDTMDDPEILTGIQGLVYLTRTFHGDSISWDDADVSLGDIAFVVEDRDIVRPPDPPVPGGDPMPLSGETQNETGSPMSKTSKAKTKTLKSPSTAGS